MQLAIVIGVGVLLALIVVISALKCYKVASPTEALIITGSNGKKGDELGGQRVSIGGAKFVIPFVQQYQKISLESQQVPVRVSQVPSRDKIRLDVEGVVTVKVKSTEEGVRAAAQRFGDKHEKIAEQAQDNLSGTLRSVIGEMTVEEILGDRAAFADKVMNSIDETITNQGLQLDSFQINEVSDKENYIENLGRPTAAQALSDAEIAESNRRRESQEKDLNNQQFISDAQKNTEIRKAENRKIVDEANAEAESIRPREEARRRQEILREDQKAAEEEAILEERRLDASVRKQADAKLYESQKEAEARRYTEQQEADARFYRAERDADAVKLAGAAEAEKISSIGEAEALATEKRAEAMKKYGDAAIMEMKLKTQQKMAEYMSDGIKQAGPIHIVSTDGMDKFSSGMTSFLTAAPAIFESIQDNGESGLGNLIPTTPSVTQPGTTKK